MVDRSMGNASEEWRVLKGASLIALCFLLFSATSILGGFGSGPAARAAFPGERGLIAFSKFDQIYTVAEDGKGPRQLTTSGINRSPSWSADGARLAWTCDDDICISDADGSEVQRLTGLTYKERRPSWSPDGRWIVFTRLDPVSDEVGPYEPHLYKLEVADPDNEVQLTDIPSADPEWSPDGDWIIFLKGGFHAGELWLVRPDGTESQALNDETRQRATPSWSPDSSRIAYLEKRHNRWRVCISTADGKVTREFAIDKASALGLTWSPDGRRLAFVGVHHRSLVVVKPNGDRIRHLDHAARAPDWQPL